MRIPFILAAAGILASAHAQYNGPESVEYDPVGDRYFVSNTASSSIKQRAQDGTVTDFVTGIAAPPYGIELQGDTLFACVGTGLKGYLTADGSEVFELDLGAGFPNGLASDGHYLYATDFGAGRIFRADPAAGTFTTWVANTNGTPNGIVYDPVNDRLAVAFWGNNAAVKTYDRQTAAPGPSMNTGVSSIDGITIDCLGRYLIASWTPDQLAAIITFDQPIVPLLTTGLSNPADIDFDAVHDRVCIPNSGNNTVTLFEVTCSVGVPAMDAPAALAIRPAGADGVFMVQLERSLRTPYRILDARGAVVAQGLLPADGRLDLAAMAPGVYVLHLPELQRSGRVVR